MNSMQINFIPAEQHKSFPLLSPHVPPHRVWQKKAFHLTNIQDTVDGKCNDIALRYILFIPAVPWSQIEIWIHGSVLHPDPSESGRICKRDYQDFLPIFIHMIENDYQTLFLVQHIHRLIPFHVFITGFFRRNVRHLSREHQMFLLSDKIMALIHQYSNHPCFKVAFLLQLVHFPAISPFLLNCPYRFLSFLCAQKTHFICFYLLDGDMRENVPGIFKVITQNLGYRLGNHCHPLVI